MEIVVFFGMLILFIFEGFKMFEVLGFVGFSRFNVLVGLKGILVKCLVL